LIGNRGAKKGGNGHSRSQPLDARKGLLFIHEEMPVKVSSSFFIV
jgi:hypothetical protein